MLPRQLSSNEIGLLASRKDVKRIAVENFLGSLGDITKTEAIVNLNLDAKLYKWNSATRKAIEAGIKLAYYRDR